MAKWRSIVRLSIVSVLGLGLIVVLMVWLAGAFHTRIEPGPEKPTAGPTSAGHELLAIAPITVPRMGEAIGTIQPEHEVALASQLQMPARVLQINASPGRIVQPGELIARLDDSQVRMQLAQAQAQLASAQTEYDRLMALGPGASQIEKVRATNSLQAAKSKVEEIQTVLSYTEISAPPLPTTRPCEPATQPSVTELPAGCLPPVTKWMVINRFAEAGQIVQPGQTIARLFDRLQLIALVPESMRPNIAVGQQVAVHIDALDADCTGTIAEIVPQAEQFSRLFQVKVVGPCQPGVIIGMSARMQAPTGQTRQEILVPAAAVRRVGQLTMVYVDRDGRLVRQLVQLGRQSGGQVAVISGLNAGDRIVRDASKVND